MATATKIQPPPPPPPPAPEPRFVLDMSKDEADAMMALLGAIAGEHPLRTHYSAFYNVLSAAGLEGFQSHKLNANGAGVFACIQLPLRNEFMPAPLKPNPPPGTLDVNLTREEALMLSLLDGGGTGTGRVRAAVGSVARKLQKLDPKLWGDQLRVWENEVQGNRRRGWDLAMVAEKS